MTNNNLTAPYYYGVAGKIVTAIEPHSEADPIALLIQFLTFFGNIVGRNAYFKVEEDMHYPNLFTVIVGDSSKARKGTSYNHIRSIFEKIDFNWTNNKIKSGLSSGEGIIHAVRDDVPKKDGNDDDGVTDKRLLAVSSEFASVLSVMTRSGNILSSVIRDAWDTGKLSILVRTCPEVATNTHISMIGHITKFELESKLSEVDMFNGFANRFIWFHVKRSKLLPEGGDLDKKILNSFCFELKKSIDFSSTPKRICFNAEARSYWYELYQKLSITGSGYIGAITSRAEPQVLRLALIYALLDSSEFIRIEHLKAAESLWAYSMYSCSEIFSRLYICSMEGKIIEKLSLLKGTGCTRSEINDLFSRNKKKIEIDQILDSLQDEKKIYSITKNDTGGRPEIRWFIKEDSK